MKTVIRCFFNRVKQRTACRSTIISIRMTYSPNLRSIIPYAFSQPHQLIFILGTPVSRPWDHRLSCIAASPTTWPTPPSVIIGRMPRTSSLALRRLDLQQAHGSKSRAARLLVASRMKFGPTSTPIHLDSYSQRLSWNPSDNVATEVSYAFIKSPEVADPQVNQHRLVASLLLNKPLGAERNWYNGFVFGQNSESGGARTSAYLAESDYQRGRNTAFARIETGTRSARDLVIPGVSSATLYKVGVFTVGAVHDLTRHSAAAGIGVGGQLTFGTKGAALDAYYGTGTPLGYELFFRIRPPDMAHSMASMSGMSMGSH